MVSGEGIFFERMREEYGVCRVGYDDDRAFDSKKGLGRYCDTLSGSIYVRHDHKTQTADGILPRYSLLLLSCLLTAQSQKCHGSDVIRPPVHEAKTPSSHIPPFIQCRSKSSFADVGL